MIQINDPKLLPCPFCGGDAALWYFCCSYAKRLDDGTWQTVDWAEICNYLTDMIDKYKAETEETDGTNK